MRLQITSVLEATVLLGTGVGAVLALGVRSVRRTPQEHAVVAHPAGG